MLTSLSSNAIAAKARAIYGKRLRSSDYRELLHKRSVSDIAVYLKSNTNYAKTLSGINETAIHRGQLENLLHRHRLNLFISLCHYDFSPKRGFFRSTILDVEITVILRTIMLLNSNQPEKIVLNLPTYMKEFLSFDMMRLSTVKDFGDLLRVLGGTPYPAILQRFKRDNGSINLSECEYELKCFYYRSIFRLIDQNYHGKAKRELMEIVQIEVDLLNLALIYRLKTYFKRLPGQIMQMLLPFHYKLNERIISQLLEPMTDNEFINRMCLSSYSGKMKNADSQYLEGYTRQLLYLISRKLMRFSTSAPAAFYSLMTLSKIECENITTIIEGIRYENPSADIEKLLILE